MAKNDLTLLDERLSDYALEHACTDEGKNFDSFASTQILKQYDLTDEELAAGITDGADDGGIDMWYMFMNGQLLQNETCPLPKSNCSLEIILITCKHANEFVQETINCIYPSVEELFDVRKDESELKGTYNDKIKKHRRIFMHAYADSILSKPSISFTIYYASRGDSKMVTPNVQSRATQLENHIETELFGEKAKFVFYGAAELLAAYRERLNFDLSLSVISSLKRDNNNFVALAQLSDYYFFITENDHLRTYLFDSNVREYLGSNDVNDAILNSLRNDSNVDFWFLNNGITILASNASIVGKKIRIENVQIINGLQTSNAIYKYFTDNKDMLSVDTRAVTVKIISQNEKALREKIIRSTNNQSAIQLSSLFATDKKQLDIEDYLQKHGFGYERRKNSSTAQAFGEAKTFDIIALAKGYTCIIGKAPECSYKFKQKRLTKPKTYDYIFGQTSLEVWLKIAQVLYSVKRVFGMKRRELAHSSAGTYGRMAGTVQLLCIARIIGKIDFSVYDFEKCDLAGMTDELILVIWKFVAEWYERTEATKRGYILGVCIEACENWHIRGIEHLVKEENVLITNYQGFDCIPDKYKKYAPKSAVFRVKKKRKKDD